MARDHNGEDKLNSDHVSPCVFSPAEELESILETVVSHKELGVKSGMERICLHFRAFSAANENKGSPNVLLSTTSVKMGDIPQCWHISLFISVFIFICE